MAWLATLDARAQRASRPVYWLYLFLKWNLVAIGAWALFWLGIEGLRDKHPNLGVAFLVYLAYTGVSLAHRWWHRTTPH